ncbi:unnamed protein product, partial [Rotaria socialis]
RFNSSPFPIFRLPPLESVFGKYSGKPRLILDLSWPHDENNTSSINDLIDKDECSTTYSTIDQAIHAVLKTGSKAFLCKCDIASAFKLLPISPSLVPSYGCHWNDQLYFFVGLPFGGRSSPRIFDCLSQAVEWTLLNKCHMQYCQHLLDVFLTVDCSEQESLRTMAIITMAFKKLNILLSPSKTIGPVASLEYLGIILDTDVFEARIPVDKINRMCNLIHQLSRKKRCTKRELLQLIDHFNFATLSCSVDEPHYDIRLGKEARIDLSMWEEFLIHWNDRSLFLESSPITNVDLCLFTDVAGSYGYAHHKRNSTLLELMPTVISAVLWGANWSRRRTIFHCDNEALVYILNKRRSADSIIMMFIRRLTLRPLKYNFHLMALHIAGATNDIADAISRQQWARVHHLAPWADTFPCQIPNLVELIYPNFF